MYYESTYVGRKYINLIASKGKNHTASMFDFLVYVTRTWNIQSYEYSNKSLLSKYSSAYFTKCTSYS